MWLFQVGSYYTTISMMVVIQLGIQDGMAHARLCVLPVMLIHSTLHWRFGHSLHNLPSTKEQRTVTGHLLISVRLN